MQSKKLLIALSAIGSLLLAFGAPIFADESRTAEQAAIVGAASGMPLTRWDMQELSVAPDFRWVDSKSAVRSLLHQGEDYEGHPTQIFAYYASPATPAGQPQSADEYARDRALAMGGVEQRSRSGGKDGLDVAMQRLRLTWVANDPRCPSSVCSPGRSGKGSDI